MKNKDRIPKRVVFGRWFFGLLFSLFGGWAVEDKDNVPKSGAVLVCPNHISDSDPLALLVTLPRADYAAMAKEELFRIPLVSIFVRAYGAFPVVRDTADRRALRQGEEALKAGRCLVIFPEGRIDVNGQLQRLQPGAALLALKTGTPIVPTGLIGTNRVLPYGKIIPRRAKGGIRVRYGAPIKMEEFAGMTHKKALAALTLKIAGELAQLTNQPAPKPEEYLSAAGEG